MPITISNIMDGTVLYSRLHGDVTDEDLQTYFAEYVAKDYFHKYKREIIDGREVPKVLTTPVGQHALAEQVRKHAEDLRGHRAAMVASSDAVYGMFRMWEMQRADVDYELKVFRNYDEAVAWLHEPPERKTDG